MVEFINRALRNRVEGSQRSNLIACKFNSIRIIVGKRKYIDNAPAQGKLPGFDNIIGTDKPILVEQVVDKIQVKCFAAFYLECRFFEVLAVDNFFGKSFRVGYYDGFFATRADAFEHFGTQEYI